MHTKCRRQHKNKNNRKRKRVSERSSEMGSLLPSLTHSLFSPSSSANMLSAICQICMTLSSETEQITQGSLGFQEKSDILAEWPPWMKSSSGGPSTPSSSDCSSPIQAENKGVIKLNHISEYKTTLKPKLNPRS